MPPTSQDLICISPQHGEAENISSILEKSKQPRKLICLADITKLEDSRVEPKARYACLKDT